MTQTLKVTLAFPIRGYVETMNPASQPRGTTPRCLNVRARDPQSGRLRGAQRAGISKYLAATTSAQGQFLTHIASSNTAASSATSLQTRLITNVAVSGGNIQTFTTSGFATPTGGTGALSATVPILFGMQMFGKLYFIDGTNAKVFDPVANTVTAWTASAGSFPSHSTTNLPRLGCLWRARLVLSGIKTDAANWFMTATGTPDDFDYGVDPPTACQAVAGNTTEAGKIPDDIVNSLFPISDHYLLFGGDHSLYLLKGDPAENGQIEKVSPITGTAWGNPFARDPFGTIYFVGSRGGIYRYRVGGGAEKVSAQDLDLFFATLDMSKIAVSAQWNDVENGINFFLTDLSGGESRHLFYEPGRNLFWPDQFADADFNPTASHTLDGDQATDRKVLLFGRDGYIRYLDETSSTDDGEAMESYAYLGPIASGAESKLQGQEIQIQMGETTEVAQYSLYTGSTADEALSELSAERTRRVGPGRSNPDRNRWNAHSTWLKIGSVPEGGHWSMESGTMVLQELGRNERARRTT